MPTIVSMLDAAFRSAITAAFGVDADPLIAPAQNDKFGDYQANAAMGLAKLLVDKTGQKTNPRAIAEQIEANLHLGDMACEISIAGPGFINVKLAPAWVAKRLADISAGDRVGVDPVPVPQTVVVDYSGPNIAKELHVGHLRSTIIGDALVRIQSALGHRVIRQNHVGDWGTQFGMLITNLQDQAGGGSSPADTDLKDLEAFYVNAKKRFDDDPDFQKRARENVIKLQSGDPATLAAWRTLIAKTREHYLPLYRALGVLLTPEDERGESFYNNMLASVVADLKKAGIAEESDGATVVFTDGKEKSPLIVEKSAGGYLYGTTDLAAIRYRVGTLRASRIIYLVDARQSQHFAQVFATARRAGWAEGASLEHAAFGTMLGEDGRPFKTKTGGTVKLQLLLDEADERALAVITEKNPDLPDVKRREIAKAIGVGSIKYADLSKDRTSDYAFSFDKMLALDGNTAPYLLYAYARIRSIFRKTDATPDASKLMLESPFELTLAKHILRLPEVLDLIARELKPHHLTTYLYELATRFSSFYENCPVLQSDLATRASRLALCDITARTMARGLDLLGIEHPDQM